MTPAIPTPAPGDFFEVEEVFTEHPDLIVLSLGFASAHDPLDVLSKWTLIRGQLEPRVWAEIDAILDEIAENAAVPQGDAEA